MDEMNNQTKKTAQSSSRPAWQRVLALGAVLIMVIGFVLYCLQIASGGF